MTVTNKSSNKQSSSPDIKNINNHRDHQIKVKPEQLQNNTNNNFNRKHENSRIPLPITKQAKVLSNNRTEQIKLERWPQNNQNQLTNEAETDIDIETYSPENNNGNTTNIPTNQNLIVNNNDISSQSLTHLINLKEEIEESTLIDIDNSNIAIKTEVEKDPRDILLQQKMNGSRLNVTPIDAVDQDCLTKSNGHNSELSLHLLQQQNSVPSLNKKLNSQVPRNVLCKSAIDEVLDLTDLEFLWYYFL